MLRDESGASRGGRSAVGDRKAPRHGATAQTCVLSNHGAFAVYPGFHWWDSDGKMHTAVHHQECPAQHGKAAVLPAALNVPPGSVLCFRAGIEAGGKEVADEAFTYNPDANAAPEYKTSGTTHDSHMIYEGIKTPA